MIRYALKCGADHDFESWFQSAAGFDVLATGGHLTCPVCGSHDVTKGLMVPAVRASRDAQPTLQTPATDTETAIAAMRREIEANSEYVGMNFVTEARRMHDGDTPARAIYGEARLDQAKALLEDGVPVAPLPFMPVRKVN